MKTLFKGFTLIEVMLALAVIAIALTALLKANGQNINYTQRLNTRLINHWAQKQGLTLIQLGLIPIDGGREITEKTTLFGHDVYWRARTKATSVPSMEAIHITVSANQSGPFMNELIGYRRTL